jgi:hypothetical protein
MFVAQHSSLSSTAGAHWVALSEATAAIVRALAAPSALGAGPRQQAGQQAEET